jgi:serine/threonine-protein kinase
MDRASQPVTASSGTQPDADADLTGKTLGDFHVLRRLGQGGMGQVYVAEQLSLKRKVALKLLRKELAANTVSLQRFKAEAEAVARATHANIVQVYAIGECNGIHYMALEYVEGRNLREYLERKGPPEVLLGLSFMRQIASALQRASELGIIHRDIKPENILLTRKGEAKVADFGLSRCFAENHPPLNLTEAGVTMGTPLYMAPEQVEGRAVDPRTDIYSFGVTCYHMFAGQPPFRGQTPFEVALQHVRNEPTPLNEIRPDLPPALCALIHKMMAKKPEDRFQTGREIVKEVARLRDSLVGVSGVVPTQIVSLGPVPSQPLDSVPTQVLIPLRSRRWLRWLAAGSILLALAAGAGYGWMHSRKTSPDAITEPVPSEPLAPLQQREMALKVLVDRNLSPMQGKKPSENEIEQALKLIEEQKVFAKAKKDPHKDRLLFAVELGLLYLDQGRLTEADRFFLSLDRPDPMPAVVAAGMCAFPLAPLEARLVHVAGAVLADVNQPPASYPFLARLGHAMVLAFQDKAEESNKLFVQFFKEYKDKNGAKIAPGLRPPLMLPRLRQKVAQALNYNYINTPSAFPRELEFLRHPPLLNPKKTKGP